MPIPFLTATWTGAVGALLIGYLLGSIPFGLLFSYAFGEGDVRKIGSGTIGATNVLRTGNYAAAALTLLFDAAKGAAPVWIAAHFWGSDAALFAALGAFLGHLFPVWLSFKGGKGIAVSLGILLVLCWPVALASLATWIAMLALFRISSLAALVTAVFAPLYMHLFGPEHAAVLAFVLAVLALFAHIENIRRLLRGDEPRIGAKTKPA